MKSVYWFKEAALFISKRWIQTSQPIPPPLRLKLAVMSIPFKQMFLVQHFLSFLSLVHHNVLMSMVNNLTKPHVYAIRTYQEKSQTKHNSYPQI